MTRTLLVDTNRAAVPIYRALCDWGHEVCVVGGRPTDTLAKLASNFVKLDYSNAALLADFVAKEGFDFVVPGCTDLSYKVCAEINGGRFPGFDTPAVTHTINTKSAFREAAAAVGVPVPRLVSPEDALGLDAVIVKPVDSFSGRGMSVVRRPTREGLEKAIAEAAKVSKSGNVILEEFIEGQLYSHSAFIRAGAVVADFVVQEDCTASPFAVDTSRVEPAFPWDLLQFLRDGICRLAGSLRFADGLVHTQFILRRGECWFIEMTRRCPGDIYSLLIEFSTGYRYAAAYAAPFVGRAAEPAEFGVLKERIIRHTASSKGGDALWGFAFSEPVDIRLFVPLATSGDFLAPGPDGRAGIFFFRTASANEQDRLYRRLTGGGLYSFGG